MGCMKGHWQVTCQMLASRETPPDPRLARPAIVNVLLLVQPFIQAVLLSRLGKHISLDASPVKEIKNKGETGGASFPCQSVKEKQCQSGRPIRLFYRCLPLRRTPALGAPCFLPLVPLRWFIAASVCCQSRLPLGPPYWANQSTKLQEDVECFRKRNKKVSYFFLFLSLFYYFFYNCALFYFDFVLLFQQFVLAPPGKYQNAAVKSFCLPSAASIQITHAAWVTVRLRIQILEGEKKWKKKEKTGEPLLLCSACIDEVAFPLQRRGETTAPTWWLVL